MVFIEWGFFKMSDSTRTLQENTGDRLPDGRFAPGTSGNPAGGPKGSPNKITRIIREDFTWVLENIGGPGGTALPVSHALPSRICSVFSA